MISMLFSLQTWPVLTVQQDTRPAKELLSAADEKIKDIRELPE